MSSGGRAGQYAQAAPPTFSFSFFFIGSPKLTMPQEERRGVKTGNLEIRARNIF